MLRDQITFSLGEELKALVDGEKELDKYKSVAAILREASIEGLRARALLRGKGVTEKASTPEALPVEPARVEPRITPESPIEVPKASPWKLKGNGASIVETTVKPPPEALVAKVEVSIQAEPETKPQPVLEPKPMPLDELAKNLEGVTLKVDPVKLAAIVAEESEENPETYSPEELGKDTSILDGLEDYLK